MLIQNYAPTVHKTINNQLVHSTPITPNQTSFSYNAFRLPTLPLSSFPAITPNELNQLFQEQLTHAKKVLKQYQDFNLISKSAATQTLKQYEDLYILEFPTPSVFLKDQLEDYVRTQHNRDRTIFQNPNPAPSPLKANKTISLEAIRSITWYTFTPYIPRLQHSVRIQWQEELLTAAHNQNNREIIIDGSRQIGKSNSTSEILTESSFLPNFHQLVAAPSQDLTNLIKNYVTTYISEFTTWMFEVKSKENFILNTFSGSRIHFKTLKDEGTRTLGLTLSRIIIDEAQLVDIPTVLESLKPTMLTTKGQLILLGTAIADTSSYMYSQIMEHKKWNPNVHVIKVSIYDNPLISPQERDDILADLENPMKAAAIKRQYLNQWGWDDSQLFIPNIIPAYDHNQNATLIISNDPARKNDRSAYSVHQVTQNNIITIESSFIPNTHKSDWTMQRQFMLQKKAEYQSKYKRIITVMDVSGVGDGVSTIFEQWGYPINYSIRYTAWENFTTQWSNQLRVGKIALINNAIDLIWEGIHECYEPLTKTLIEEFSHLQADFDNQGKIRMKSKYFDDETNALLIALFISTKLGLHLRPTTDAQTNRISSTFKKELEAYYWKPTPRTQRSHSHYF